MLCLAERLIKKKRRIFNPGMRAFTAISDRRSRAQRRSIRRKLGPQTWRRLVSHFLTNCRRVRRFTEVPWKYCFRRSKYRRPTSGRLGPISEQRIEVVDPPRVHRILSHSLSLSLPLLATSLFLFVFSAAARLLHSAPVRVVRNYGADILNFLV